MLCHHYKTIFVHIPKNAGQSVVQVFLDLLGLEWKTRAPLLMRWNDQPELGPPALAHLSADEYVNCKYVPQEMFDSYFKFAIVRNPWDRVVSIYKYIKFDKRCDFPTFVSGIFRHHIFEDKFWFVRPQCDFVLRDGELAVDFLARFETIESDWNVICDNIGLPHVPFPHRNPSGKLKTSPWEFDKKTLKRFGAQHWKQFPKCDSYQEYYDSNSRDVVASLYRADIDRFRYSFDGGA